MSTYYTQRTAASDRNIYRMTSKATRLFFFVDVPLFHEFIFSSIISIKFVSPVCSLTSTLLCFYLLHSLFSPPDPPCLLSVLHVSRLLYEDHNASSERASRSSHHVKNQQISASLWVSKMTATSQSCLAYTTISHLTPSWILISSGHPLYPSGRLPSSHDHVPTKKGSISQSPT